MFGLTDNPGCVGVAADDEAGLVFACKLKKSVARIPAAVHEAVDVDFERKL